MLATGIKKHARFNIQNYNIFNQQLIIKLLSQFKSFLLSNDFLENCCKTGGIENFFY